MQGWLYFVGVLIFARGMISGGLMGMPRRTLIVAAPYHKPDWNLAAALSGVGGTLMFVAAMMCFFVLAMTAAVRGKDGARRPTSRGDHRGTTGDGLDGQPRSAAL